jgi:hypothetical protein
MNEMPAPEKAAPCEVRVLMLENAGKRARSTPTGNGLETARRKCAPILVSFNVPILGSGVGREGDTA